MRDFFQCLFHLNRFPRHSYALILLISPALFNPNDGLGIVCVFIFPIFRYVVSKPFII